MKPIDGTYFHSRMIVKVSMVPLVNILLIIVLLCYTEPLFPGRRPGYQLHETGNGKLIHLREELFNIYIDWDSRIFLRSEKLENLSNFKQKIEDILEEEKIMAPKVALRIHKDVDFGTVQHVMKLIGAAGIKKVTLISSYPVSLSDVMMNQIDVRNE